ncbi:50S ribosomal protein L2 [Puniceicoccales bacterium CK1056]|uniref:Large ribosomal subunit protein uL2 n=1 Tax=Oceanipulchritudo coccoides TaxID=2706888 RepID=A0A6B2M2N7_9BACT|nr:50S ribosomal protein L2 [Oceanipulchritudo coccoides]NDV62646.1 50S ribosomal protein L2 [Oceanipulchritudo coccoides]
MPIISKRPITPAQRFHVGVRTEGLSKERPVKSLTESKKRTGGRNFYGRITSRRRGGGHKKLYRRIDFRRDKIDMPAEVIRFEYDPNRSANIALVKYEDDELRYILAPNKLNVGDKIINASESAEFKPGNSMPLKSIPAAMKVHNIEIKPNTKAQMVRTAGVAATLVSIEKGNATLRMPSGEIRMVKATCRATIGEVGNSEHANRSLGKAGRSRWKGRRPRVRGVAMNPVDHPMGGGEGRTSGGGHPVSPWGQLSKGFPTRKKNKASNKLILVRRNGRKVKN